jgi:chromate transporter
VQAATRPDGRGAERPTIGALFAGFFSIGICGFGGVLPWARRMIVEQRGWLTAAEFTDLLALCQFLPGPNVINLSVALGSRFRGARGALAAFFGLMSAPMVIILLLGMVYERYSGLPGVRQMFAGLAAVASGLVLSTALKIAAPLRHKALDVLMAVGSWAAIVLLHVPLIPAMLVLAPLGILLAARAQR